MTTPNSPTEHDESDFFEEVERELVRVTTATLEGKLVSTTPPAQPLPLPPKAVMPANAGAHAECDVPTEDNTAVTQPGYGSRPAPG